MKSYDVFISYAHADKKYVGQLYRALNKYGLRIFMDEASISWGDDWEASIMKALQNCEFGIVVISEAYRGRPWTEKELLFLLSRQSSEDDKLILPILHNMESSKFLESCSDISHIQFVRSDKMKPHDIACEFIRLLVCRMRSMLSRDDVMISKLSEYTVDDPGVMDLIYSKLSDSAKALLFAALFYNDIGVDVDKSLTAVKELIQYGFVDSDDIAYSDAWFLADFVISYFEQNPLVCENMKNSCEQIELNKWLSIAREKKDLFSSDHGVASVLSNLSRDAVHTIGWFLVSGGTFFGDQSPCLPGISELARCKLVYKCNGIYALRQSFSEYARNTQFFISDLEHLFDKPMLDASSDLLSGLADLAQEPIYGYKLKSAVAQMASALHDDHRGGQKQ